MNKLVAVYGSLRRQEYNHSVLGDSEYLSTLQLTGFKMFGKRSFPAVVKGNLEDVITVEIYRVTDNEIANELDLLEGFDRSNPSSQNNMYTIKTFTIPSIEGEIEIYTFDHDPTKVHNRGPRLKHGDWCNRDLIS